MISIDDFPKIDDNIIQNIKDQSCGANFCIKGIPYDFDGALSLENKYRLLFHWLCKLQEEVDSGAASGIKAGNAIAITDGNTINVETSNDATSGNMLPITRDAVYRIVGTIENELSEV